MSNTILPILILMVFPLVPLSSHSDDLILGDNISIDNSHINEDDFKEDLKEPPKKTATTEKESSENIKIATNL